MDVPLWVWGLTVGVVLAMVVYDFLGHVRTPHSPTLREAALWSTAYVGVAVVFGLLVLALAGPSYGGQYFAGYLTEKALSVDNLFVFVIIISGFGVPREHQQKVLLIGIAVALVLRTVFIAVGAAAIDQFSWVFWVFGGLLLWTALAQLRSAAGHGAEQEERSDGAVLRLVRRVLPTTDRYHGGSLVARVDGRRLLTPMAVVVVAIGAADVVFAVDSIPAIFGLTQETYLVFAANAFSLLGLRQLYFLVDGLLDRLVYLGYGLAAILALIGAKLVIHAMHTNELPWLNGGREIDVVPEVPTSVSLAVIVVVLAVTTAASLLSPRGRAVAAAARDQAAAREGARAHQPADRPVGG